MNDDETLVEIDILVSSDERRTDATDEFDGDPLLLDRAPAIRSKVDADRLLRILDELAAEGGDL